MHSRPLIRTHVPGVYRRGSRFVAVYRDKDRLQHKKAFRSLEAAAAFKVGNPLSALRAEADALVDRMEGEYGEALPHLYVAAAQLRSVEALAERDKEFLWTNV